MSAGARGWGQAGALEMGSREPAGDKPRSPGGWETLERVPRMQPSSPEKCEGLDFTWVNPARLTPLLPAVAALLPGSPGGFSSKA